MLGTNVFQLCKNLGIDIKYCIPLYVARGLSTLCALSWLAKLLLRSMSKQPAGVGAFFLPVASAVWCSVACYLSFSVTDGLMIRWLFHYGPSATIVRLLTFSAFNYYITAIILSLAGGRSDLYLPAWIVISLILTVAYIIQDYLTSNIAIVTPGHGRRMVNFLEVAVFCVVPVGMASFFTMILLLALRFVEVGS